MTTSTLDVKFVNDYYGSWIDIQENNWVNGVNMGQVAHGVTFINGELHELDPTAYFYRDSEPFWSPVVHADNEAVAKLYETLTGKLYPIFDAAEAYDTLIRLKAEKGFLHDDGAFIALSHIAL